MEILVVLIVGVLIAGPIIAIIAYIRVQNLTAKLNSIGLQESVMRLNSLEQRLSSLDKKLAVLATSVPTHPAPAPTSEPISIQPLQPPAVVPPPPSPIPPVISTSRPQTESRKDIRTSPLTQSVMPHPQAVAPDHLENLIGGHWLNRIGILAVFIGISFFLKYAFDNNWIGPSGRVAIGILLGALMLPWSHWLLGKGYTYFSEGIAALGEATLFLSVWAGCQYYTLYSRDVGFVAMIAITAVMAAVAIGRDSQRIAVLSLLGGLLTPILA